MINRFRALVDDLEVKAIHLHGLKFTWSSGTANPTQTKIDHILVTWEWELTHADAHMQAMSSSMSDHCPLLLSCSPFHHKYKGFRFEAWWLKMPGLKELVTESWTQPVSSGNKARTLHIKLARLAKKLKQWSKTRKGELEQESKDAETLVQ
jgi:hypothetical protein